MKSSRYAIWTGAIAFVLNAVSAYAENCTATNVVVAPLTDAHWTQGAPYNDYSPKGTTVFTSGWEAGCVAIAAAQELRHWRWPWRLEAARETSHPVLNESPLALRFDGNVPFDWDNMPASFSSGGTLAQKHAVARLVLACQSLVQMQFVNAGGEAKKNLPGTMEWFEFAGQVDPKSGDAALAALRSDFEFGSPVQTGINFKGYGGHEVVGLGYATGTNGVGEAKNLIWLNLGWGGGSDGWYDLSETSASETVIKSVQLGFRPIKSVQIEPLAPISGSSATIAWHLPDCYTNKISGFTVTKKTPSTSTTTWTDDFSTGGKGRSSNTNEVIVTNERLYGWQGTVSAIYTYDDVLLLTENSVLSYKYHDDYMAGMSVRVEAMIGDGPWHTISSPALHGGWNYAGATTETVNLGAYAGKGARFRFVVEYVSGSIWTTGVNAANVWFDDLSISNVKMFSDVSSESLPASARTTTFSNLEQGEVYAFCVTPVMSDGSAAVTQTATTTIGSPAPVPVIGAVSMSPRGTDLMQDGFYSDIAMGWNVIDVACQNVATLEAFPSHQSIVPQSKVEVVNNGNGSFSINIDASEVVAKWAGQRFILTLKATNATGATTYKDLELRLVASGVPENVPGGKIWTGEDALFGENYTAKWTNNQLPVNGDKVTFYVADGEYGAMMNLNLTNATVLGYVNATGLGQLMVSGTSSETLTVDVLKNDVQVEINTPKFKVSKAIPSANIVIDSGSSLDCEIDQSRSDYVKKVQNGYASALPDSALWKGTVAFSGYTAAGLNFNSYGNTGSSVRLSGVSGWLANNTTYDPEIELVDNGTTPALNWNNGSTGAKETFRKISGSGTFKTSGSGGAAERVVINDIDDFTGSFDLSLKRIVIGDSDPTTSNNGSITVNSGKSVTVAEGKAWKATGGLFFKGNQTITVNGTLNGAITAEGTGTTLALKPGSTVTAVSLNMANNTISIEKSSAVAASVTVSGAATLTGATIAVNLTGEAADSIALMSAGSFTGVDSVTLSGLDGYTLKTENGTLYAKKAAQPEPASGPVPIAEWNGDFSSEALGRFSANGCTITDWNQTHGENSSSVVIDRNNQGLFVDFTEAKGYVTVLVKYSDLISSSSYKRVLFATTANSDYTRDRCGIRLLTNGQIQGLWNNSLTANNDADYGTATGAVPSSGTLAFIYDKGTSGTSVYVAGSGESLPDTALWNNAALKSGDIYGFVVGGMCRSASASGVEAAKGMTITGLAVFTNILTVAEMNDYLGPQEKTTATDYPVPYSWFNEYGITDSAVEATATSLSANRLNAWWECYVLGLNPTNANDTFTATIRMEGQTPIIEFAPTNEVLRASGAIRYILQSKPSLTNDWTDCPSFEVPGDTNRFFRVKVEW